MKQYLYLTSLFLILSCNTERNIEGAWYYNYLSETNSFNEVPESITIRNDSIIFNYPYFNFFEKHSLRVQNSSFYFKNYEVPFKINGDTLIINKKQKFTRIPSEPFAKDYIENKSDIKIDLPQLDLSRFQSGEEIFKQNIFLKFYGINPESKRLSFLVNGEYLDSYDDYLNSFGGFHHNIPIDYLFVDKNAKMIDLEKPFLAATQMNQLKTVFVNDVKVFFNNEIGLYYKHFGLRKNFFPHGYNEDYYKIIRDSLNLSENIQLPPPPPPPPKIDGSIYPKAKIIELKKDKNYVRNTEVNEKQLLEIIDSAIEEKRPIFALFDLESTYNSFLNLNALINSVYDKKRERLSSKKYDKIFADLSSDEKSDIQSQIPKIVVWNYSIPHFKEVINNDGTFFGLKVR